MLLETSKDIHGVLCKVSNMLNACKTTVVGKESLLDDCGNIIKQICKIHDRLVDTASGVKTDVFPKTIPYTNLLHLQSINKLALNESEQQLENFFQS